MKNKVFCWTWTKTRLITCYFSCVVVQPSNSTRAAQNKLYTV